MEPVITTIATAIALGAAEGLKNIMPQAVSPAVRLLGHSRQCARVDQHYLG